jgi:hypothetical protein
MTFASAIDQFDSWRSSRRRVVDRLSTAVQLKQDPINAVCRRHSKRDQMGN